MLSLVAVACGDEPPAEPPRAVKRRVDMDRIPVPNHSPQVMSDPGKPRRVGMAGKMEADIGGRRQHFTFFSRGKNAAAHFESTGVSWVKIEGALSDDGSPYLSFALEPLDLAALELPATFSAASTDPAARPEVPALKVRFELSPGTRWLHTEKTKTPITLTLTSFEDDVLTGTFAGTLTRQGGQDEGDPELEVRNGAFEVKLRRTGDRVETPTP